MANENSYDVIVLGAGISGLTAAYNIKKRDPSANVVVLEAKDRVGGRTHTVPLVASKGTDHWDLGGQWVGRCQVHVIRLLKELALDTYPQYMDGLRLQQLGEAKIKSYTSEIPNQSILSLLDLHWSITKLDRYQAQLSVEDPLSHPSAAEWDAMSVSTFLKKTLHTQGARLTNEVAIRCIFGCEASQMSFLYYLLYIRMAGEIKNLIETTDFTAQEWKIKGGAQQISERLAECVGRDAVRLGDAVTSVQQTETEVKVTTASGWTGSAPYVIIAMPPVALEHMHFSPSLSADRLDTIKHLPLGNMIKVIITYDKAFWRSKSLSGHAVSDGGETTVPGCTTGPLSLTYDATSANGCPALVAFLGGYAAVEWAKQSAKVRQKAILNQLAAFFGPEVHTFLDYMEKDWNYEPFSWGGPVSHVTSGGMKSFSQTIRRPEGRIHFAGTETATVWSGYMSGAIQAGERSALEVLFKLKPSTLSESDTQIAKQALAMADVQSLKTRSQARQGGSVIKAILAFSVGFGLVAGGVYLATRYIKPGETTGVYLF